LALRIEVRGDVNSSCENKSSFSSKQKSKQLLEIAKTVAERAIKTDEATATTWVISNSKH
jgi:hypothetical protein